MPNGHGEERDQWMAIQRIEQSANRIEVSVARLEQCVTDHVTNGTIHQVPPCEAMKSVNAKMWAAMTSAVVGLASAVWHYVK